MFELVEYIGALGEVLAMFETLDACAAAVIELDYLFDGHGEFVCEVVR